jgi:hypothetical protein
MYSVFCDFYCICKKFFAHETGLQPLAKTSQPVVSVKAEIKLGATRIIIISPVFISTQCL